MFLDERILLIIDALNSASIPFMVVGSYASNLYGIPRSTKDFDVVVELKGISLGAIRKWLPPDFKLDPQLEFEGITGTLRNVIRFPGSQFIAEIFQVSSDPHDVLRFQRRIETQIAERSVSIPTVEDVVITKLRWGRTKDIDDLHNVFLVQRENRLDWDYIYHWVDQHGTRERLAEILASLPQID